MQAQLSEEEIAAGVAAIWRDVLVLEEIPGDADFFELGGHSLLAARVGIRIAEEFGVRAPVSELIADSSFSGMVHRVRRAAGERDGEQADTEPAAAEGPGFAVATEEAVDDSMDGAAEGFPAIAIVGMSCAFPGADGPEEFWRNIRDGVESVTELTDEELLAAGENPAVLKSPNYIPVAACIDGIEMFDAAFFGMSPREAELMDPQQRLFLEHSWRALEAGGYDPTRVAVPVGVYGGSGVNSYIHQIQENPETQALMREGGNLHEIGAIENDPDYLTTRVSYKLNLTGPAVNVTTACSTSLVAIHLACQALRTFECDMALAGGVAITPPVRRGYLFREGGINSADGHTRAFDQSSSGTVLGAGVGVVLLKRLDEALADGDVVHGVIIGSAVNNDGGAKASFTAPGIDGQAEVTATAHAVAGVPAETITYQEAHGTATKIGDPIEVAALTKAFREQTDARGFCALGTVKANIGHMDTAAGVAGLIKATMAVKHGVIPPQLHVTVPNPALNLEQSPFYIATEPAEWNPPTGAPRRSGVSSFGFGGTNAHVIVEQPPTPTTRQDADEWQILPVSARGEAAVQEYLRTLADWASSHGEASMADVSATLRDGRTRFGRRAAVVARTAEEAAKELAARASRPTRQSTAAPEVAFLFPGQGSQYPGMARDLYEHNTVFRAEFDACADVFAAVSGHDLRDVVLGSAAQGDEHPIHRTELTQPALFAVEYSLARTLAALGVEPAAMLGHSLGELVAATIAGVLTRDDAMRAIAKRGALMAAAPAGGMLMVRAAAQDIVPLLPEGVSIGAYNAAESVAVTGPAAGIEAAEALLAERGLVTRRLRISMASHSALMEDAARRFTAYMSTIPLNAPRIPFVSNVTGTWITDAEACDPAYWGRHLRQPVRFEDGLRAVADRCDGPLLECGPGDSLLSLAKLVPGLDDGRALVQSVRHPRVADADLRVLYGAVAALWECGLEPVWPVPASAPARKITLPTYPFQRQRYWIDAHAGADVLSRRALARVENADRWLYAPQWSQTARPGQIVGAEPIAVAARRFLIVSDSGPVADALNVRLLADGAEVRVVSGGQAAAGAVAEAGADSVVFLATQASGAEAANTEDMSLELLKLGRALAEAACPADLTVVTGAVADLTGGEKLNPSGALLAGIAKVLPREIAGLDCRLVDVDPAETADRVAADLAAEVSVRQPDAVVAYRCGRRWVQRLEPLVVAEPAPGAPGPREGGVYLITGGMGGIGLSLAEFLARRFRARLVLAGSSPVPPREQWNRRLRRVEEAAAALRVVRSDVSDREQVFALIETVTAEFGRLDGVIHAAGRPGGGLVQTLEQAAYLRTLAPKTAGADHLLAATAGRGLDFLMLFSSLNTIDGRFGIADYTAANAYLDAVAHKAWREGRTEVVTVDWTGWRDLGMAVNAGASESDGGGEELRDLERLAVMSEAGMASFLSETEGHDVFLRTLAAGLPQVCVSTQDLAAVIEHGRRLDIGVALASLEERDRETVSYQRPDLDVDFVAPAGEREAFGCETFQMLLGIDGVGVLDDFFELGGNSLLAIDVVARMRKHFGTDVPLAAFLQEPTARALAALVAAAGQ